MLRFLGPPGAHSGPPGADFGTPWALLGPLGVHSLGASWGSFWSIDFEAQKGAQTAMQNCSKKHDFGPRDAQRSQGRRSWSQVAAGMVLGTVLCSFLDPPEPQKLSSRLGAVLVFTKIALHARESIMDPTMTPKLATKQSPEAPRWTKMPLKSAPRC